MDKSPVGARDCRAYFNTLARVVYSLQFPPVDINGLMCADAITPKRLWRFPGSRQRPERQSLGEAYSNSESQFGWSDLGQLIMHGREHLVGITAHEKGLVLVILRYADELREPESFFDKLDAEPKADAVKLAVNLIEEHSGKFEPQKMPNEYALAVHELVQAKIEQRAPEVEIETEKREAPKVVNIMDALKKSMQAKGQRKVRDALSKKMGKGAPKRVVSSASPRSRPTTRRTAH